MLIPRTITYINTIDTSLKLVALILTAIMFWKAYRMYKLYREQSLMYFTIAFFFFTVGNFFSFIIDVFIYTGIMTKGMLFEIFNLHPVVVLFLAIRLGSLLLGFLYLFFIALGFPKRNVQVAIVLLTIIAGITADIKALFFHLSVTVFTAFVLYDLYLKYKHGRKRAQMLYFMGMAGLYLAYASYALFLFFAPFYWIGHGLEILSYLFFIAALYAVITKNETKARKTRNHT